MKISRKTQVKLAIALLLLIPGCGDEAPDVPAPDRHKVDAGMQAPRRPEDLLEWARQNPDSPAVKLWMAHDGWTPKECIAVARHEVIPGMTPAQVKASWGAPQFVNPTILGPEWGYPKRKPAEFIYFENGSVSRVDRAAD